MKYLLDTHSLIWYLTDDPQLSERACDIIERKKYLYASIVSLWEIGIKKSIGKLKFDYTSLQISEELSARNIGILQIAPEHIDLLGLLPPVHKDPFDRMLIAQTLSEDMTLITKDENIPLYAVKTVW